MQILNNIDKSSWISSVFSSAALLAIVSIYYFRPEIFSNETVYLIPSRQVVDSSFLAFDWNIGPQNPKLSILFNVLLSPLWLLFNDPIKVALVGRLLVWFFLSFSLIQFAKTIGIKGYSVVIGAFFWLSVNQSLCAGEWIFGGVEQKCFAYAFLFLSLAFVLQSKIVRAGLSCGIAIWFHLLVGGWGAIGITGALLLSIRKFGWTRIIWFIIVVVVICIPYLPIIYNYAIKASQSIHYNVFDLSVDELIVTVRNPHHLDPYFFLTAKKLIKICIISISVMVLLPQVLSLNDARFLQSFILILLVIFTAGLLARPLHFYGFLKLYPFRVVDVLLLLFFWIIILQIIVEKRHFYNLRKKPISLRNCILIILLLFTLTQVPGAIKKLVKLAIETRNSWCSYQSGFNSNFAEITNWIKYNTEENAIFVVHPCEFSFLISAERASVVSYKLAPSNARFAEWYERITILNDDNDFGTIKGMGKACKEIKNNFTFLNRQKLGRIKSKYNADYYLTYAERDDLQKNLIYHNEKYYLYSLKGFSHSIIK